MVADLFCFELFQPLQLWISFHRILGISNVASWNCPRVNVVIGVIVFRWSLFFVGWCWTIVRGQTLLDSWSLVMCIACWIKRTRPIFWVWIHLENCARLRINWLENGLLYSKWLQNECFKSVAGISCMTDTVWYPKDMKLQRDKPSEHWEFWFYMCYKNVCSSNFITQSRWTRPIPSVCLIFIHVRIRQRSQMVMRLKMEIANWE